MRDSCPRATTRNRDGTPRRKEKSESWLGRMQKRRNVRTYDVRSVSMVEKFYRGGFWLRHGKTEGRKRVKRGVEEEYADPSKDEREVQRRLRKPVSVRDNRGASD